MIIRFDTPEGPIEQQITGEPLRHILELVGKGIEGVKIVPDDKEPVTQILQKAPPKTWVGNFLQKRNAK